MTNIELPNPNRDSTPVQGDGDGSLISVVIVTYNSKALLAAMDIKLFDAPDIEVIVVDNNSQDGSAEFVLQNRPSIQLIETGSNLGFAKAVNIGARIARGSSIVLLNPDAVVALESIRAMHEILEKNSDFGAVAPLLDHPGKNLSVREAGMRPSIWRVFCHYFGLSRIFSRNSFFDGMYVLRDSEFDKKDVDWVSGACIAVPTSVWRELGGLTERWFMYAEDVELCLRIKRSGRRVVLSAEIQGDHGLGQSNSDSDKSPTSEWLINLYDLYKTEISHTRLQNLIWKYLIAAGMTLRAVGYAALTILRRKPYKKNINFLRFSFYAKEILKQSSKVD